MLRVLGLAALIAVEATVDSPRSIPLCLSGPTASGKSAVALAIARRFGGEILSADSMQVYRGLDIGTAKPSPAEQQVVRHHLIDLVPPAESFDTARWLTAAHAAVETIRARDGWPIFCGGTGLYFRAWFRGLDAAPPPDPELRAALEATPVPELLAELQAGDPATYARVDRNNPRRVIRAVEILRASGPRPVESGATNVPAPGEWVFALRRDSEDLRRRIDQRVDAMFADGLVEETRALSGEGGWGTQRTAQQAIGYRQVIEHLRGERGLADTVALVKSRTWQFARRQMAWLRHQLRVHWIEVAQVETVDVLADRVVAAFKERHPGDPASGIRA